MKTIITLIFIFCFSLTTKGQISTKKIFYYDSKWKKAESNSASYYRIAYFDSQNKPINEVRDYYISGKIQGIQESAIKIDEDDDSKSIFYGKITWFYENGTKKEEGNFNSSGIYDGKFTSYDSNGNFLETTTYANGKIVTTKQQNIVSNLPKQCKLFAPMKNIYANGLWTGEVKNELADGNGTFTSDIINFTGFAVNGKISGYAEVTYTNKARLAGKFIDGVINGEGILSLTNPISLPLWNGNFDVYYMVANFTNGLSNGKLFNYDRNGKLLNVGDCVNNECSYTSSPPTSSYEIKDLLITTGIILGAIQIYKSGGVQGLSNFYSKYGEGLVSCGLQYQIGGYINDPRIAAVVTESIGSVVEKRKYESKNVIISSAMNYTSQKLQESNNPTAAKAVSLYAFYDCLYENWFK